MITISSGMSTLLNLINCRASKIEIEKPVFHIVTIAFVVQLLFYCMVSGEIKPCQATLL